MRLHLLAMPLVGATLLSTLGCSKKDDPSAFPSNIGSYKLDGRATACQAKCSLYTGRNINNTPLHSLTIELTSGTNPQAPTETTWVVFSKYASEPVSAYVLTQVVVHKIVSHTPVPEVQAYQDNLRFTITATGSGGYSGTFSADSNPFSAYPPKSTITEGAFTDVHL